MDSFYITPFKKEIIGNLTKAKFEDIFVNIPEKYDDYLKLLYGIIWNYTPLDQRRIITIFSCQMLIIV